MMKKYVMQCIPLDHRFPPFLGMGFTSSEFQTRGIRTHNETRVLTENINLKFFKQEESHQQAWPTSGTPNAGAG
jgi:hypothetical protein